MWDTMSEGLTPLSPPLDICPVMVFCKYMRTKQVKCGYGLIDHVLLRTGLIRAHCLLRRTWDREPNQLGLVDFRYISAKPSLVPRRSRLGQSWTLP